ncbi:MAG TPA: hypothetical protein VEN99_02430 [Acidimicrobiia bacterium]|nr:hypothetical protein [Acidimicrobiia bacterium]
MKRALAAAFFGGVLILSIPQLASATPRAAQHVGAYHDEKGSDSATAPKDAEPKKDAPGEGRSHFDRQAHDNNNSF